MESEESEYEDFNAFQVMSSSKTIDAFATAVESPLATNDPMMSRCVVEGVARIRFECDTAASHSTLSKDLFDRLQMKKPHLKIDPQEVTIRLADGSISTKSLGTVQLDVKRSARCPRLSRITFFILDGPNNLLGRYALQKLFPVQYHALS